MTIEVILLYAAMFGGIWFFLVRPQKKRQQEQKQLRDGLQVGDTIVTIGGFVGKVTKVPTEGDDIEISINGSSSMTIKKWAVGSKK